MVVTRPFDSAPIPCSLYVHLPWCVEKCPYCDFNSHRITDPVPQRSYINTLLEDLDSDLARFKVPSIQTIYFGGGTPSVFEPEEISRFLLAIHERLDIESDAEITLEANPGTVDGARFTGYRQAGVNRLSIGVQSFNAQQLKKLGRIHDRDAALVAADAARSAGFTRYNLDLMFALPGQTQSDALEDIETALGLGVNHLSSYQLTIEPNTAFAAHPPILPDNDAGATMHDAILDRLARADLNRYEVSAFASDTHECRHNTNYWQFGDYLGIGAGAHGKFTDNGTVMRTARVRHPKRYLSATSRDERLSHERAVSSDQVAFEFVLNALRLADGFSRELFQSRTGLSFDTISNTVDTNVQRGLLMLTVNDNSTVITTTPRGYQMLDDVVASFLPDRHEDSEKRHAMD